MEIPDKNLFMMCSALNHNALSSLPQGYYVRRCRRDELDLWMAMPFDDERTAAQYKGFMESYFTDVYGDRQDEFFARCLFVCDEWDRPIGTCFAWKCYGSVTTIHWFKVLKGYECQGIGRALLSVVMKSIDEGDYPVFLHTQPGSYRAIKLYSDFGFALLKDPVVGYRDNELADCLPVLQEYMPRRDFESLRFEIAPQAFLDAVRTSPINQF